MNEFEKWEQELGPEITAIGKSPKELTDEELDMQLSQIDRDVLDIQVTQLEEGESIDRIAELDTKLQEILEDRDI